MRRASAELMIDAVQAARVAEIIDAASRAADIASEERDALREIAEGIRKARTVGAVVSLAGDGEDLPVDSCTTLVEMVYAKARSVGYTTPIVRFEAALLFGDPS